MPQWDGPFEVIERIGPNAYKMDLPGDYGVPATINEADLSPYYDEDEQFLSLRSNFNQSGEYDGDHPLEPFRDQPASEEDSTSTKEIREVHALVQEVTNQPLHLLPSSAEIWPNFINLLSTNAKGMTE